MTKGELIAELAPFDDSQEVAFDDGEDGLDITSVEEEDGVIYICSEGDEEEDEEEEDEGGAD